MLWSANLDCSKYGVFLNPHLRLHNVFQKCFSLTAMSNYWFNVSTKRDLNWLDQWHILKLYKVHSVLMCSESNWIRPDNWHRWLEGCLQLERKIAYGSKSTMPWWLLIQNNASPRVKLVYRIISNFGVPTPKVACLEALASYITVLRHIPKKNALAGLILLPRVWLACAFALPCYPYF